MSSEQSAKPKEVPRHGLFFISRYLLCGERAVDGANGLRGQASLPVVQPGPSAYPHPRQTAACCTRASARRKVHRCHHRCVDIAQAAVNHLQKQRKGRRVGWATVEGQGGGGRGEQHEYGGSVTHTPKIGATACRHQRLPTSKLVGPHAPCRCPTQRVP